MESSCCPQSKLPFPTLSATSKGEPKVSLVNDGMMNIQEIADERKLVCYPTGILASNDP
ncbi:hypothetical protein MtrunA17_Chr4g0029081 [Medicago truncatula]|uniref:Uncharacterized protein n=1 Tax=Medicago truncatula TaxID=3880 RepID=A0A396ID36_MEDTR|nr:hypothetical protein MtrunA17_Chr4g0029081 [Medicago truncatula]